MEKMILPRAGFSGPISENSDIIHYIREHTTIDIPRTRANDLHIKVIFQRSENLPDFITVYFFSFPASMQSTPVHIKIGTSNVLEIDGYEDKFWQGRPFYVDAIGFGAQNLTEDFRFVYEVMSNAYVS